MSLKNGEKKEYSQVAEWKRRKTQIAHRPKWSKATERHKRKKKVHTQTEKCKKAERLDGVLASKSQ